MNNRVTLLLPSLLLGLALPLLAAEPVWIDVSSPEEYARQHLAEAIHIPHTRIARDVSTRYPDKNTPLNLYDSGGNRAQQASEALQTLGYRQVSAKGGFDDLAADGLPGRYMAPEATPVQAERLTLAPASHTVTPAEN
ncbi:hypothetical protein GCM10022421_33270 [Oceanisphaera sediminis]|uniref:Rhodanese domain-containing protein n=1 Tax=Oceanisphaera sediminis TaxID=981381 RepID=A0ABP7EQ37_9GAMM